MEQARTDIGMRLIIDGDSYEKTGRIMDAINAAVANALLDEGMDRAAFDFTHFNTHPCKGYTLDRLTEAVHEMDQPMPEAEVRNYYREGAQRARAELPPVRDLRPRGAADGRPEPEPVSAESPGVRRPVVDSPQG